MKILEPTGRASFCLNRHLTPLWPRVALALAAVLGLVSCASTPVEVKDPLPDVVIDAHAHLFNARYVPIKEICVANHVPTVAAGVIEVIVLFLTKDDHLAEASSSARNIRQIKREAGELVGLAGMSPEKARARAIAGMLAPDRLDALNEKLTREQRLALRDFLGQASAANGADHALSAEEIAQSLEKARPLADIHDAAAVEAKPGLFGYLRFLRIITAGERTILASLQETYPDVDLFVHHMMDLEGTYGPRPEFDFSHQVDKMIALQNENPGAMLTFGAYDPFRRGDALNQAKSAYDTGVSGFKFYPPNGYRPAENIIPDITLPGTVESQWHHRYDGLQPDKLDERNREFFRYCIEKDIPVFVHCTPQGFEAVKDYYGALMADPKYWASVLKEFRNLRLCFGHSGGEGLWFNGDETSRAFGRCVIALCQEYDNVYCDAGFWSEVLSEEGIKALQEELPRLFAQHSRLSKKLVYGTDWFMISTANGYGGYLASMARVFSTPKLSGYRNDFFAGNEARFLRLDRLAVDPRLTPEVRAKLADLVKRLPDGWNLP